MFNIRIRIFAGSGTESATFNHSVMVEFKTAMARLAVTFFRSKNLVVYPHFIGTSKHGLHWIRQRQTTSLVRKFE